MIGAPGADPNDLTAPDAGAAYVYRLDPGDAWVYEAKLWAPNPVASAEFGRSVALFQGLTVCGAPQDDEHDSGAAYAFAYNGGLEEWYQQDRLADPGG